MTDNDIIFTVIFSTLIILLLIAAVVIIIFIANRHRTGQEIKMAQMRLSYEQELRTVEHEVQEQVLANVSRELHDNIGQLLTVIHLQLEQKKIVLSGAGEALAPIHDTLDNVIHQVKTLGRGLSSDLIEQNGLLQMMQMEVERILQLDKFTVHWSHDNAEPALSRDQRLMSFRIFQEIINNTLKHSGAQSVRISMIGKDGFELDIQDDGVGYDSNSMISSGKGAGLKNIIKRAAMANMQCTIDSAPGKGSYFSLKTIKSDTTK